MKRIISSLSLLTICFHFSFAQTTAPQTIPAKPKLVVGIVIDQMRYDFLWRYWDLYGEGGFKKLVNNGFLCQDDRYTYFLTTTAPGHSTIYTGTTPAMHGIVENYWYDHDLKKMIYVMTDSSVKTVGNATAAVSASPFRLMTSTVTDELKLASAQSKVIGIAEKDRAAIMPSGHRPDGAYWFDVKTGNWITSTWYMNQLPEWLKQFNASGKVNSYLDKDWTLMLPREKYSASTKDTMPFENPLVGESLPVFPHHLAAANYINLTFSPFGNSQTKDVAIEAIKGEQLGKRDVTDFLCISFSSTDLIGHFFGPNSLETEDCYLRLDKDLAELLKFLDDYVGMNNVALFLTADHGVAMNPAFGADNDLNGGIQNAGTWTGAINSFVSKKFGEGKWVDTTEEQQVWLNKDFIASKNISAADVALSVQDYLMMQPGVLCVTAPEYNINTCNPYVQTKIMNGYMPKRSGDILFSNEPGWVDWYLPKGTSHGTVFSYDDHVPLIWYGWKIAHGTSADPVSNTDIAPTISNWLNIALPSGCTGKPITQIKMK